MKNKLNTIKEIVVWLIVIFAIGMMIFTIFSVSTFDQNDRSVFGYKFFISRSDSMSATDFDAGDVIFVKNVAPETLKEGDVIAYTSQNDASYGETITHKIREVTTDENGEPGFITYGTTTDTNDETVVTYEYVIGKYVGKIPNIGSFFAFLKTIPGYLICILLPFLLLIGYYGWKSVKLFKKYRKEQEEELQAERKKIADEKRQSQEMMEELQRLRLQLAAKEGVQPEKLLQTAQNRPVSQQPAQQRVSQQPAQRPQTAPRASQPAQRPQTAPRRPVSQQPVPQEAAQRVPQNRPSSESQWQRRIQQPESRPVQPAQQRASQPAQQPQTAPRRPVSQQPAQQSEPVKVHRISYDELFKSK